MDRYLLSGAFALFILQACWFLNDLRIVSIPWLNTRETIVSGKPVGSISETKKNVRRRAKESLVWEESNEKDLVYNFDSFLTLPQSSATLSLDNSTKIAMSENTLIIVEPFDETANSKIRLRFAKGDIKARNIARQTQIVTEEWTVDAQAGAEINLRRLDNDKLEMEVIKGSADLASDKETKELKQGQILAIEKDKIVNEITVSQDLAWKNNDDSRFYHHQWPANLTLRWKGSADSVWHLMPNKESQFYNVSAEQDYLNLSLTPGTHLFRLRNKDKISRTLSVHLWQAPILHLLSPLPRDRTTFGSPIAFAWSAPKGITAYRFQISHRADFSQLTDEKKFDSPSAKIALPEEGEYFWRIIGIDEKGFFIPPNYDHQLFNYSELLDAPVIKAPRYPAEENKPLPDGAKLDFLKRIFNLILPAAEAQEKKGYDVLFEWEPVKGAERYLIEIDLQGNFRSPMVLVKTEMPKFLWTDVALGKYFWRVAAERGQTMGKFTKPNLIDLNKVLNDSKTGAAQGITLTKTPVPPSDAELLEKIKKVEPTVEKAVAAKATRVKSQKVEKAFVGPPKPVIKDKVDFKPLPVKVAASVPEAPTTPPQVEKPKDEGAPIEKPKETAIVLAKPDKETPPIEKRIWYKTNLYFGFAYEIKKLTGDQDVSSQFSGLSALQVGLELETETVQFTSLTTKNSWKPKSASSLPFQGDIEELSTRNALLFNWKQSQWRWGASFAYLPTVLRSTVDAITIENDPLFGVALQRRLVWNNFTAQHFLSLAFASGDVDFYSGNHWQYQVNEYFRIGAEGNIFIQSSGSNGGQIGLTMGLSW